MDIAEDDPVDVGAAKLIDAVSTHLTDPVERSYVGVRLGRLLGVPYPDDAHGDLGRDDLFAGWRMWFERLAASDPVVLVIEDLHCADRGLLEFLDHLIDWARDAPIYVLALARLELEAWTPGWPAGRNRTVVSLDPLDATSTARLLDALVPGMPKSAKSAIADRLRGIPLYAVETLRSLIDRDIVVPQDGVYRLVADLGPLGVPDTLHGLIAARLDNLDPALRSLIADASVLGTQFSADALRSISARTSPLIDDALVELVRHQILEVTADPLSPQRGSFGFTHSMFAKSPTTPSRDATGKFVTSKSASTFDRPTLTMARKSSMS